MVFKDAFGNAQWMGSSSFVFRQEQQVRERVILYGTPQCEGAPPSAIWICGEMSALHKL